MTPCIGMRLSFVVLVAVIGCGPSTQHSSGGGGGSGTAGGGGTSSPGGGGISSGGGGGASGPTFGSMCSGGAATTISGVVKAPNGVDPISDALVYVPASSGQLSPGVSCDLCVQPVDSLAAHTQSNADGSFTLDISSLPQTSQLPFTISKGRFRRATTLAAITPCVDNPIGAPNSVLPGKSAPGDDIPKIAVATGSKDALDVVLAGMGLDTTLGYDCYQNQATPVSKPTSSCEKRLAAQGANAPQLADLLKNETMLEQYNMLFISCALGRFAALSAADQATIVSNLQTWVGKGGRLFAVDRAYDYVAQSFPTEVTFVGGTAVNAANVGVGSASSPATYSGRVNDTTLAEWLTAVGALQSGQNTISLTGYLTQWSVVQSLPMSSSDEVDATNAQITLNSMTTTGTYPQTVKFDVPPDSKSACGRVVFSSYHTLGEATSTALTPQEQILEYLMFEAGACLGAPIT
jgi:hypothetical protein